MRAKLPPGVLIALALLVPAVFLIPAAPAMAQTGPPGLNESCQPVERKVYKDIRELMTIDLDTATDVQVRMEADRILYVANQESLPVLPGTLQGKLDGTPDDLRAFLKTGLLGAWTTDLRVTVVRTLTGAGPHVKAAAQKALDNGGIDAFLAFLNDGLYAARALDCASQPPATPSATTPAAAIPSSATSRGTSGGQGGGLPVTGADTGTVAGIGGVLLLIGGAGYLVGRRRRSRFVA
ncbi:ALF repeat-containing protein [Actinoplanes subtropicus]|uniref:ALF repeat-containing protein n=1 Tax=Actinoplanes subtropicus TaxID=543632 RepID=UPI0004C34293|nr:ALF repeat-containing protein [Actinoplanes subtropicus]